MKFSLFPSIARLRRPVEAVASKKFDEQYEAIIASLETRIQVLNQELDLYKIEQEHAHAPHNLHGDSPTGD